MNRLSMYAKYEKKTWEVIEAMLNGQLDRHIAATAFQGINAGTRAVRFHAIDPMTAKAGRAATKAKKG